MNELLATRDNRRGKGLIAVSVGDSTLGQVICGKLYGDFVTCRDLNEMLAHLTGYMG